MDRDDMYHACLLIHGPPPQQYAHFKAYNKESPFTLDFYHYRAAVRNWLSANFEMRGGEAAWIDNYIDWTQENRRGR